MTVTNPEEVVEVTDTKIKLSIKPMLFLGSYYYPYGGWEDFKGFFDDIESAKKWVEENTPERWAHWAHIVKEEKIVFRASTKEISFNEYIWEWEEEED